MTGLRSARRLAFALAAGLGLAGCQSTPETDGRWVLERLPNGAGFGGGSAPIAPAASPTAQMTQSEAQRGLTDVAVLTGPPARTGPPAPPAAAEPESRPEAGPLPIIAATGAAAPGDVQSPPPAPASSGSLLGAGDRILVDSLVGQINGRPVYASEFFAPMDARMRAEAAEMPARQWLRKSREDISRALRTRIVDELLLAEFEAGLRPEQRAGLIAYVRTLRDNLISLSRGSSELAEERYREAEGLTLDEKVRNIRDRELIRQHLTKQVADRVFISWREVEIEYERNRAKYVTPGQAQLRMIWVPADDTERIDRVTQALAAGELFAAVAARESDYNRAEGGLEVVSLDEGTYAASRIFAVDALNDQAKALTMGAVSAPFRFGQRMVWLQLESIVERSHSLYELQWTIHQDLWQQRFIEENIRYLEQLSERGSMTRFEEMLDRLLVIAADRYLIAGQE